MKSRSVSLTGATGFLGWHIATEFAARGWHVRAITRPESAKPLPPGVEARPAALEAESLKRALDASDLVVHAAGVTRASGDRLFRSVNVDGTRAVVAAANAVGSRLIHISSLGAIGPGTPDRPVHEDDRPQPVNAYAKSKLASEAVVRSEASVPWTILRPAAVYGPRDRQFLPLVRLASRGLFLMIAPPSTTFTLVYVDDVARAVAAAAESERAIGEAMFVGHAVPQSGYAILRQLAHIVGRPFKPRHVPSFVVRGMAVAGELTWRIGREPMFDAARLSEIRSEGFVCSVERARLAVGFVAEVGLAEGLERTVAWYRTNGWI
jgi:nucleoside-diphosphate-sugar epimerase